MGMMGGAALGLGAGVLGGALIADAVNDHDQEIYQEGYSKLDPDSLCLDGLNTNNFEKMMVRMVIWTLVVVMIFELACSPTRVSKSSAGALSSTALGGHGLP